MHGKFNWITVKHNGTQQSIYACWIQKTSKVVCQYEQSNGALGESTLPHDAIGRDHHPHRQQNQNCIFELFFVFVLLCPSLSFYQCVLLCLASNWLRVDIWSFEKKKFWTVRAEEQKNSGRNKMSQFSFGLNSDIKLNREMW